MTRFGRTALWTGRILLGLLFTLVGLAKLIGGAPVADQFENWGYPGAFRFVVGVVEFLCGLATLIPATTRFGAYGLIVVMTGAFLTHAFNAEFLRLPINVVLAGLLFALVRASLRSTAEADDPNIID